MEKLDLNEEEIFGALERSGYLLESEISKKLNKAGYFVETGQVIIDPFTGKSREIDLTAQYYQDNHSKKCLAKINFVFEIKNNAAPIVLLTEYEYSPNRPDDRALKQIITIPKNIGDFPGETYRARIVDTSNFSAFTQYCSFQKKNNKEELMAIHPEPIFNGLGKIVQYCEEALSKNIVIGNTEYYHHTLYLPVLLINQDLYELKHDENNTPSLKKVDQSMLVYNYHHDNYPQMAFIYVITKKHLPEFMQTMRGIENAAQRMLERKVAELR